MVIGEIFCFGFYKIFFVIRVFSIIEVSGDNSSIVVISSCVNVENI